MFVDSIFVFLYFYLCLSFLIYFLKVLNILVLYLYKPADVWAACAIIFTMLYHQHVLECSSDMRRAMMFCGHFGNRDLIPLEVMFGPAPAFERWRRHHLTRESVTAFFECGLRGEPTLRPTSEELLQSAWLTEKVCDLVFLLRSF
jgi:hypothetical protein